jgi:hypothetical protein
MKTLKLKLFPLAIAVLGALAASGGHFRFR